MFDGFLELADCGPGVDLNEDEDQGQEGQEEGECCDGIHDVVLLAEHGGIVRPASSCVKGAPDERQEASRSREKAPRSDLPLGLG